jgi:hypothetical protein
MRRLLTVTVALLTVALLAGCGGAASPSPAGSPSPASPSPVASPSPSPGPSPAISPSPAPSAAQSVAASPSPCAAIAQSGPIRSESLTDVQVVWRGNDSRVIFVLGPPDPDWPAGQPIGDFADAEPPFDRTASGQPIEVPGDHHIRVRLENMKIVDADGDIVYDGPDRITPDQGPIRAVVQEEAFEGVVSWIVGFDGPGCPSVTVSDDRIVVSVGS